VDETTDEGLVDGLENVKPVLRSLETAHSERLQNGDGALS
jgi:hypothetical protein